MNLSAGGSARYGTECGGRVGITLNGCIGSVVTRGVLFGISLIASPVCSTGEPTSGFVLMLFHHQTWYHCAWCKSMVGVEL